MRKLFRMSTLAVLALTATALTAQAQEKATELTAGVIGIQSTSADCTGCGSIFEFATGGAYFAVGFYLSPGLAIEPTITSSHISFNEDNSDDNSSITTVGLGVAVPYYFKKGWGRKGPYVAPRLAWNSVSVKPCNVSGDPFCDSSSQSQFGLGLAVGTKVPLNDAAALRIQGSFDYGFASGSETDADYVPGTTAFGASLGLSVFLK